MTIQLSATRSPEILAQIAQKFETQYEIDCHEMTLNVPDAIGKGFIKSVNFKNGVSLLTIKGQFTAGMDWKFVDIDIHPLRFCFCLAGSLRHHFNNGAIQYELTPLQGSITAGKQEDEQQLFFPINEVVTLVILEINRAAYFDKVVCELPDLPPTLGQVFTDKAAQETFFYQSNYSIATAECSQEIIENSYANMVRRTFLEAKAFELISTQIRQYEDDLKRSGKQVVLKQYDLEKIQEARHILVSDLQNAPTIAVLARKVGLNQQKLKKGFKQVYDNTINRYLRSIRLEKAKLLLVEGTLSIGEIAEQVGYTNRSHFARRFREKYGVLPKDFAKKIVREVTEIRLS